MEFGWIGGPLVVLLIVLVNGFFVGSEMAMVASRRNRLEQQRADGNANAAAALRTSSQPPGSIRTTQVPLDGSARSGTTITVPIRVGSTT